MDHGTIPVMKKKPTTKTSKERKTVARKATNGRFVAASKTRPHSSVLTERQIDHDWDRSFARSQDALARLADEALAEHRAGRTKPLDPDTL